MVKFLVAFLAVISFIAVTRGADDIVAWDLGGGVLHVGVVSDRKSGGSPLILHNIGSGAKEEDLLFKYQVIGHYRLKEITQGGRGGNGTPSERSVTNRTSSAAGPRR